MLDVKKDFPIFSQYPDLVYFDNAATTQKPRAVIDSMVDYYTTCNANPLRGLYELSNKATMAYEVARNSVARFINALDCEVIFTRNATESLNLVAAITPLKAGDEVVLSTCSHHSGMLPWLAATKKAGATLSYMEINIDGTFCTSELDKITARTKVVSIPHISNVLGCALPIKSIIDRAHKMGSIVVLDGAQSIPHLPIDVKALDADYFAWSAHKICGPMGCGVLYGRKSLLESAEPFLRGGEMIEYVTRTDATWAELPHKFEAGTVNCGGAVGCAAAIDYVNNIGLNNIARHEDELTALLMDGMKTIPHVHIIGNSDPLKHHGIVTFTIDDVHPHDIASILDADGIAIRAGHHCTQVLHKSLGLSATARASLYFYNTKSDVERFIDSLGKVRSCMGLK